MGACELDEGFLLDGYSIDVDLGAHPAATSGSICGLWGGKDWSVVWSVGLA